MLRSPCVPGLVLVLSGLAVARADDVDLAGALPQAERDRIRTELRVRDFALRELSIPVREELPSAFSVTLEVDGDTKTVRLERRSTRAPDFRLLVQVEGGAIVERAAPPARTYVGGVEGEPDWVVAASLVPSGLRAAVLRPGSPTWVVRPLGEMREAARRAEHVVYSEADIEPLDLTHDALLPEEALLPEGPAAPDHGAGQIDEAGGAGAAAPCTIKVADIGFDSDYEFYDEICNSDADACVALIEDGLNHTNQIYIRDLKITHRVSRILVRTDPATDFYAQFPDSSNFGAMLVAFREEWNRSMTGFPHDVAYYVTGKPNPQYGGLAYVSVACSDWAYGMGLGYWGFAAILRHELGHNWGAGHDCGLERHYIMCGNSIDAFSAFNIEKITSFRDSRGCLDETTLTSDPEAPYVRPDRLLTVEGSGPLVIDVLAGDTDRNCDDLRIVSHDASSGFGAEVHVADAPALDKPDSLLYLPRSGLVGLDTISYTVSDGNGAEERGNVLIEILPRGLVGYWRLDETTGTTAIDSSGYGHDGELEGTLSFDSGSVAGRLGQALKLPGGDDDSIAVDHHSLFDLQRSLTVAAWFRVDAFAGDGETLVSKGGDAWRLKRDGTRNALKFTCTGLAGGEVRGSVLVNDGAWHHAAGVYDGARLSLYIDGELDASVPAAGAVDTNTSSLRIGDNAWNGAIDEVRVYNHGLSADEIKDLHAAGRLDNPAPANGATGVTPASTLRWVGSSSTAQYDVYLGKDRASVAAARPGSPEHGGRRTDPSWSPPLEPGTAYWWRVDEVRGAEALKGAPWYFTTAFASTEFDEPALNASSYDPGPGDAELGFQTTSTPTDGQDPFAGVIDTGSTPTSPIFSHRSTRARTTFDPVDLTGLDGAVVSLILQARDTGYEPGDRLEAYVTSPAGRVNLLSMDGGPSLNQFAGTGYWILAAVVPEDWSTASLVLDSSSDSSQGSERFDFDSIAFSCHASSRVLGYTRFAEPAAGSTSYAPGAGARELGFSTVSSDTGGASPRTGVVETASSTRSRVLVHRSVSATTTFAPVPLPAGGGARVWAVLRVAETGYESEDLLQLHATNGAERVPLIDVTGTTGLGELADGAYRAYGADLPAGWAQASLVMKTSSNSGAGSEEYVLCAVELVAAPMGPSCGGGEPEPATFRRGDANADGTLNLSDGIRVLNYLFLGGSELPCADAADTNDSGSLDLSDGIGVFNFLFLGGAPPAAPGHESCGPDATDDTLDCAAFPDC